MLRGSPSGNSLVSRVAVTWEVERETLPGVSPDRGRAWYPRSMRRYLLGCLAASSLACGGAATESQATRAPAPEPTTITPVRVPNGVAAPLRAGVWSESVCGDACVITELRFLDDGTVGVRRGVASPADAPRWEVARPGRYVVEDAVVAWSYEGRERRATFVERVLAKPARTGWSSLGFRASPDEPRRFVHEHATSFGVDATTTEVAFELTFDTQIEEAARRGCGASLRARIELTSPIEPPATMRRTETLVLRGRVSCRVEPIVDSNELRVRFVELADRGWERWWQANVVGFAPQSSAVRAALFEAMEEVLVADPVAGTLRGAYDLYVERE